MSIEEQRQKLLTTNLAKYGGEAGYKAEMKRRGMSARKVGKGGFYNNPELARKAGSKSKRLNSAAKGEEGRNEHGRTLTNTGNETPATKSGDKATEA